MRDPAASASPGPVKKMKLAFYLGCLVLILTGGCAPFTPEPRTPAPESLPSAFSMYSEESETGEAAGDLWWESYGSPELNRLVAGALGGNFSLREAWARLEQARAQAAKVGAAGLPQLTGEAGYDHVWKKEDNLRGEAVETETEEYSLGLGASYELDLWGRIESLREVERAGVAAGRADLETAAMTVAAEAVDNWIDLLAVREELGLLENQVRINAGLLELQEVRFENSAATALDVLQQREVLAGVTAQIPSLKAREQNLKHALALLQGLPPGTPLGLTEPGLPQLPPLPEPGLPADLLAMRPDVRAAGLKLKASDWEVAAARADRLPTLTLTGGLKYSGDELNVLFNNWILSLAASLTGPIFDGGRREAETARVRAVVDERLAAYEKIVLTAVLEVENALVNERRQREHLEALEKELAAAELALGEAERRYTNGLDNFIPMLTELLNVQVLQRELIREKAVLLQYRVALHRALGGGWTGRLEPQGLAVKSTESGPGPESKPEISTAPAESGT